MNLDDYPNQEDLLYLVRVLERDLRDSDKKIDELKQQIQDLEKDVNRIDSQKYNLGCFFYLYIPITLLIAWFWFHN